MDNPMFGDSILNPRISSSTNEKSGIAYKDTMVLEVIRWELAAELYMHRHKNW